MYPASARHGHTIDHETMPQGPRFTMPGREAPSPIGDNGPTIDDHRPKPNGPDGGEDPAAPSPIGDNGRDARGRFTKGNRGGPGNPFARRVARLRTLLFDVVSEDDLRCILMQLVASAKAGDVAAARLLLSYLIGKPGDAVDPDRLDLEEWQLQRQNPTLNEFLDGPPHQLDPAFANRLAPMFQGTLETQLNEAIHEEKRQRDLARAAKNAEPPPEEIEDDTAERENRSSATHPWLEPILTKLEGELEPAPAAALQPSPARDDRNSATPCSPATRDCAVGVPPSGGKDRLKPGLQPRRRKR